MAELESLVVKLRDLASEVMGHTTAADVSDKSKFDSLAKEFMDVGFAITKIESKGKVLYAACKTLLEVTIKLLRAKKAGQQKKMRQRFVKAIGKFNTSYERFCDLLKTKYGIIARQETPARTREQSRLDATARLKGLKKSEASNAVSVSAETSTATAVSVDDSAPVVRPLAPGWTEQFNEQYQTPFWHNKATGVSTWVREEAEDKDWTPPPKIVKPPSVPKVEVPKSESPASPPRGEKGKKAESKPPRSHGGSKRDKDKDKEKDKKVDEKKKKEDEKKKKDDKKKKESDKDKKKKVEKTEKPKKLKKEQKKQEKEEDEALAFGERLARLEAMEAAQGEKTKEQLAKEEAQASKMEEKLEKLEKIQEKKHKVDKKKKPKKEKKKKGKKLELDFAEGEYNENADYWDGDPNSLLQKSSLNDEEDLDDDDFLDESDDEDLFVAFNEAQYIEARTAIENGNVPDFTLAIEDMKVNMISLEDGGNTYACFLASAPYASLLHWAVAYNNLAMVRLLLQRGARNLSNGEGVSPFEIASMEYHQENNAAYFEVKNLLTALAV